MEMKTNSSQHIKQERTPPLVGAQGKEVLDLPLRPRSTEDGDDQSPPPGMDKLQLNTAAPARPMSILHVHPSPTTETPSNGESLVGTESSESSWWSQMTDSMTPPPASVIMPTQPPPTPLADTTAVTSSPGSIVSNEGAVTGAGIGLFAPPSVVPVQPHSAAHREVSSIGSSPSVGSDAPVLPLMLKSRGRRVRRGPGGTPSSSSQSPAANMGPPPVGSHDRASLEDVPPFSLPPIQTAPSNAPGQTVPTYQLGVLRSPQTPGELSRETSVPLREHSIEYNPNTNPEIHSALSTLAQEGVGSPLHMPPQHYAAIRPPPIPPASMKDSDSDSSSQGNSGTGGGGIRPTPLINPRSGGVPPPATPPSVATAGGATPERSLPSQEG